MRLAEYIYANFPQYLKFDQLALYPDGMKIGYKPLLAYLIASLSKITSVDIELVGAFLPPIVGSLTVIPVYFLGKVVFNKYVGLLGALIFVLLPGEFLHRSLLGYPDHHFLEAILSLLTILFLVRYDKGFGYRWSVFSGVSLGLYLMNWFGAYLLVAIIATWFLIKYGYLVYSRKSVTRLAIGILMTLGVASFMSFTLWDYFTKMAMGFTILIISAMWGLTLIPKWAVSLALVTLGPVVASLAFKGWPIILERFMSAFWGFGTTISEANPTSLNLALDTYGLGAFMALGGVYLSIKNKVNSLFVVFYIFISLLAIGQLRWGYYMASGVALLSAYLILLVPKHLKEIVRPTVIFIMTFFLLMSITKAFHHTINLPNNITTHWYDALVWLNKNSPEPYNNANYYTQSNLGLPKYGILTWWDYGDWVIRIAKRSPSSNNMASDEPRFPNFITSKTKEEAEVHLKGVNIKYVLLDWEVLTGKWYAVQTKAKRNISTTDSIALRLWAGELEGYKLVYTNGHVRIIEKVN